jgi:hypothetical protein
MDLMYFLIISIFLNYNGMTAVFLENLLTDENVSEVHTHRSRNRDRYVTFTYSTSDGYDAYDTNIAF